ncbi:IS3 family transposase, partial [Staphylococcus aureus]|nr:IS3 family transposase [Staphylococcus aureus]
MKATKVHSTSKKLLGRTFDQNEPGKVYLTDITYIYYGNGQKAYISCVKDSITKEIITHVVSRSLKMDIVYRILKQLNETVELFHPEAMIYSDQGIH